MGFILDIYAQVLSDPQRSRPSFRAPKNRGTPPSPLSPRSRPSAAPPRLAAAPPHFCRRGAGRRGPGGAERRRRRGAAGRRRGGGAGGARRGGGAGRAAGRGVAAAAGRRGGGGDGGRRAAGPASPCQDLPGSIHANKFGRMLSSIAPEPRWSAAHCRYRAAPPPPPPRSPARPRPAPAPRSPPPLPPRRLRAAARPPPARAPRARPRAPPPPRGAARRGAGADAAAVLLFPAVGRRPVRLARPLRLLPGVPLPAPWRRPGAGPLPRRLLLRAVPRGGARLHRGAAAALGGAHQPATSLQRQTLLSPRGHPAGPDQ